MDLRIKSFGVPRGNTVDALVIVLVGGRTVRLRQAERDSDGTAAKIRTRMRSRLKSRERSEFHVHKNRDGSFTYAVGKEPTVWPEDDN